MFKIYTIPFAQQKAAEGRCYSSRTRQTDTRRTPWAGFSAGINHAEYSGELRWSYSL